MRNNIKKQSVKKQAAQKAEAKQNQTKNNERERKWVKEHRETEINRRDKFPLLKKLLPDYWSPSFRIPEGFKTDHLFIQHQFSHQAVKEIPEYSKVITDITEKILTGNIIYFYVSPKAAVDKRMCIARFARVELITKDEITLCAELLNERATFKKTDFVKLEKVIGVFKFIEL